VRREPWITRILATALVGDLGKRRKTFPLNKKPKEGHPASCLTVGPAPWALKSTLERGEKKKNAVLDGRKGKEGAQPRGCDKKRIDHTVPEKGEAMLSREGEEKNFREDLPRLVVLPCAQGKEGSESRGIKGERVCRTPFFFFYSRGRGRNRKVSRLPGEGGQFE